MSTHQQPTTRPTIWQRLNPPLSVRRWAYGVSAAALAVLGTYGVLNGEQIAAWGVAAAALFGVAAGNARTPK